MNKIEELKKELEAKKTRLAEINAILATVKGLEKEKSDLVGFYRGNGQIKRLETALDDAILSEKLSKSAQYHYNPYFGYHDKPEPCSIAAIDDKFIIVYDSNNRKLEFRISDGMEKGKRSDSTRTNRIDAQGAIAAYNLHNGIAND